MMHQESIASARQPVAVFSIVKCENSISAPFTWMLIFLCWQMKYLILIFKTHNTVDPFCTIESLFLMHCGIKEQNGCSLVSLYNRLYLTPAASSKQPVKDNEVEVVVSDWLPMPRMWHEKVSSGTFTCNEPIMYPKILKHGLPVLRLEFMVLSRFIMYYRVFIRRLYANGHVSFGPKFWSTGS